jgi:hypothetical protein
MGLMTEQCLLDILIGHLAKRKDFWHVVFAPKRETWFSAEAIAALSVELYEAHGNHVRVFGEESYNSLRKLFKEHRIGIDIADGEGSGTLPDISVLDMSDPPQLTIIESKLIAPTNTQDDDDVELASSYDLQARALGRTVENDGLLDQLDKAHRLVPSSAVYGLVFGVHRVGQCEEAQSTGFYERLRETVKSSFSGSTWELWGDCIRPVPGLQSVAPLAGSLSGSASLGIGIVTRKSRPETRP